MALKLHATYPGRFDSPSENYPQGKWRNRSNPTAHDGGYLEEKHMNDVYGFFGALLHNAEMTPNGEVDTAKKSQFYEALVAVAEKVVGEEGYRKLDNNEFEGFMQIKAETDAGTGVSLICPDGNVRGRMSYDDDGLQFEQFQEDGTQQTFTFPRYGDGGEIVLDKNLPYVTPEMFGAVGDGVTNDFDALQMAFNVGGATSRIVVLEGKTYCYNRQLQIRSNTDIRMARNTVLKTIGSLYTGLKLVDGDSSNVSISGGIIDMQGHLNLKEANSLAGGEGKNLWIYSTTFRNIAGFHAIDLNNYDNVVIDSCRFEGQVLVKPGEYFPIRREAIQLPGDGGHTNNYKIVNCSFGGSEDAGTWRAAIGNHANVQNTESANNILIHGNTFDGMAYSAIVVFGHEGWIISNNTFNDCASGIRFEKGGADSTATCSNIIVQGNIINNIGDFIVLNDKLDNENPNLHNNIHIIDNICTDSYSNFVTCRGARDLRIAGNTIKNIRRILFASDVPSSNITLESNTVVGSISPSIQLATDTGIRIHNNYFRDSTNRTVSTGLGKHTIDICGLYISESTSYNAIEVKLSLGGYCHVSDITFKDSVFLDPPINISGDSSNVSLRGVQVSAPVTVELPLCKFPVYMYGVMPYGATLHPASEGSTIQVINDGTYIYSSESWVKLG